MVAVSIPRVVLVYLALRYNQISPAYLSSRVLIVLISLSEISSAIIVFALKFFLFHSALAASAATASLRDVGLVFSSFSADSWAFQSVITSLIEIHRFFPSRRSSTLQNQLRVLKYDRLSMRYAIFLLGMMSIFTGSLSHSVCPFFPAVETSHRFHLFSWKVSSS